MWAGLWQRFRVLGIDATVSWSWMNNRICAHPAFTLGKKDQAARGPLVAVYTTSVATVRLAVDIEDFLWRARLPGQALHLISFQRAMSASTSRLSARVVVELGPGEGLRGGRGAGQHERRSAKHAPPVHAGPFRRVGLRGGLASILAIQRAVSGQAARFGGFVPI